MATTVLVEPRHRHANTANADFFSERRRPGVEELREEWTRIGNITLNSLEKGPRDGPVVVLLHGSGKDSSPEAWVNVINQIPGNFHVISLGFPGFGKLKDQVPSNVKYSAGYLSEVLGDFLKARGIDRPITLMGTSAGAFVAAMYAADNPGMVHALSLGDCHNPEIMPQHYGKLIAWGLSHPNISSGAVDFALRHKNVLKVSLMIFDQMNQQKKDAENEGAKQKNIARMLISAVRSIRSGGEGPSDSTVEMMVGFLNDTPKAFFDIVGNWKNDRKRMPEMMEKIRKNVPIIAVIHGTEDGIVPMYSSEKLADMLDVKLQKIEGAGHAPYIYQTSQYLNILGERFFPRQEEAKAEERSKHPHLSNLVFMLRKKAGRHHQKEAMPHQIAA